MPGADFTGADVPEFCTKYLGEDYDFLARTDARYGTYLAGARRASAPRLPEDAQLAVEVHNIETWRAGATVEPTLFYLDVETLPPLTTGRNVPLGSMATTASRSSFPSPCFLTMEYADGSSASLAVAVNTFDYFFYRGLSFQTDADILGIFGLSYKDF